MSRCCGSSCIRRSTAEPRAFSRCRCSCAIPAAWRSSHASSPPRPERAGRATTPPETSSRSTCSIWSTSRHGSHSSSTVTIGASWRSSNEHDLPLDRAGARAGHARARHGIRRGAASARPARAGPRALARHALRERHAARADLRHPDRDHAVFRGGARHRRPGLCFDRGGREIPAARRGHRMNWAAGILIVLGAALALGGSLGLLRLKRFYERVHPPTIGTPLGTGLIPNGSMLHFSGLGGRPVLHEILIGALMTVTTPVTYMFLVRAALHRDPPK